MSGQMRWLRDSQGVVHPDDSILLAYTRQQSMGEGWPGIQQHLDICEQCCQRYDELVQTSILLTETLEHFQRSHHYPSLTENVFESIQNPSAARLVRRQQQQERRRRSSVVGAKRLSLISMRMLPVTVLLLTILLVAAALAYGANGILKIPQIPTQIINGQGTPSVATVTSHMQIAKTRSASSPTVKVTPTPKAAGTETATGTATPSPTQPTLKLCTTSTDKAQWRIRICGNNFTPSDKVQLVVHLASGDVKTRHQVIVNTQGIFQDFWYVFNCKDYPVAVDVQDVTHPAEVAPELQSNQLGQCSIPTPAKAS